MSKSNKEVGFFSLNPIFTIERALNGDLQQCLLFAVCIFGEFIEVANSVKIKFTGKFPNTWYVGQ